LVAFLALSPHLKIPFPAVGLEREVRLRVLRAAMADRSHCLHFARHVGYGGAPNAQHLGELTSKEWCCSLHGHGSVEAMAKPSLDVMESIASGGIAHDRAAPHYRMQSSTIGLLDTAAVLN
jgi:hypothetical protein